MLWPARSLGAARSLPYEGLPSRGCAWLWALGRMSFVTTVREDERWWLPHISTRLSCVTFERGAGTCSIY